MADPDLVAIKQEAAALAVEHQRLAERSLELVERTRLVIARQDRGAAGSPAADNWIAADKAARRLGETRAKVVRWACRANAARKPLGRWQVRLDWIDEVLGKGQAKN